jgi:hypothetical protein
MAQTGAASRIEALLANGTIMQAQPPKAFILPAPLAHALTDYLTQRPHLYSEVAPLVEGLMRLHPVPLPVKATADVVNGNGATEHEAQP